MVHNYYQFVLSLNTAASPTAEENVMSRCATHRCVPGYAINSVGDPCN